MQNCYFWVANFEDLFAVVHLLLLLNQFLLYITFQHPLKSARKHWKKNDLFLAWRVFDEVLTQKSSGFWNRSPFPFFYVHVCSWATTFFHIRCEHKASLPTPSPHTQVHTLPSSYLNAFKYLPIKSYQLLIQLKKNREEEKNIASCF